ncbi:MAG: hypothetical protein C0515_07205 [Novosphingobium sp.]|nr:hypothetical protein [Novosphingobium sp.]
MTKQPPPQQEDTFHQARSRLVDAYARLEARLAGSLVRAERPVKGDTVASKLKTLRDAATTQSVEKTADALERHSALVQIRADLVQGVMHPIDIDGERSATFRNAREAVNTVQQTSLIS